MPPPLSIRPQPPENWPQIVPWGAKVQKRKFQFFGGVPGEDALFVALVNAVHNRRKTFVRTLFKKIRSPIFVPASKSVEVQNIKFQNHRQHRS